MSFEGERRRSLPAVTAARRPAPAGDRVRIPRVVHRCLTMLDDLPDRFVTACHDRFAALNPDFTLRWYDFPGCRAMLAASEDDRLARTWDALVPNAYRADLWRLFVLREHGGMYLDAPFVALAPLSD